MPSDVFWTGLFTFGGGGVGAGAGYLTARLQQSVQRQHLKLDEKWFEAEHQQRARERHDALQERRREVYLRYLGSFDALHTKLNGPEPAQDELLELWSSMIKVDNEVELFGGEEVKGAINDAAQYVGKLLGELDAIITNPNRRWDAEAPNLRKPDGMGQEMLDVREELLAQMKADLNETS